MRGMTVRRFLRIQTCVRREKHVKTVSKCRREAPGARRGPREVVFFERKAACAGALAGAKVRPLAPSGAPRAVRGSLRPRISRVKTCVPPKKHVKMHAGGPPGYAKHNGPLFFTIETRGFFFPPFFLPFAPPFSLVKKGFWCTWRLWRLVFFVCFCSNPPFCEHNGGVLFTGGRFLQCFVSVFFFFLVRPKTLARMQTWRTFCEFGDKREGVPPPIGRVVKRRFWPKKILAHRFLRKILKVTIFLRDGARLKIKRGLTRLQPPRRGRGGFMTLRDFRRAQ